MNSARKRALRVQQAARRRTKKLITSISHLQPSGIEGNEEVLQGCATSSSVEVCVSSSADDKCVVEHSENQRSTEMHEEDGESEEDHCVLNDCYSDDLVSIWRAIDEAEGNFVSSDECDDDSDAEKDDAFHLRNGLAEWANDCCVPLSTVTRLLSVLRKTTSLDVPAQASTLLRTPRTVTVMQKSGNVVVLYSALYFYDK